VDNKTNDERKQHMKTMTNTIYPAIAVFAFCCFALLRVAQAVSPAPDGGYPGQNAAEGQNALLNLTTGVNNTAIGWYSLKSDTTHSNNTAIGTGALYFNNADGNTAVGCTALFDNTGGTNNTADGAFALYHNNASGNTAIGFEALFSNTTATGNTAVGSLALNLNTTGIHNTAVGTDGLYANVSGKDNTALGYQALEESTGTNNTGIGSEALGNDTSGFANTAIGSGALGDVTTGGGNIALGLGAGNNITTANNVICIGADGNNVSNSCYIGEIFGSTSSNGTAVFINSNGRLGTTTSSRRFKEDIKPMAQASEALLALKPVTFHYKKEIDPTGTSQFGLVAEEVANVNPDLVVRDKKGKPYSVRYDQVNAMLLNEFLKEHKAFVEAQHKVEKLETTIATLVATVKEQAAQIQKVSAQLQLKKPTPRTVSINQ